MPGIISNALTPSTKPGDLAYSAETEAYDPTLRQVDPATETVAGQLNTILDSGSPLITRARAGAAETANSRGLLNSSMAAEAGESAAIGAALPIAQSDANVYGTAAQQNQGYENAAGQFNAASTNAANANTAAAANTTAQARENAQLQSRFIIPAQTAAASQLQKEGATQKLQLQSEGAAQQLQLQGLKGDQATQVANIEANYKQLMQTNASAASVFNESMQMLTAILGNPNTSAEQKASAVQGITATLQSSMEVIGAIANLDLSGLLNFNTP